MIIKQFKYYLVASPNFIYNARKFFITIVILVSLILTFFWSGFFKHFFTLNQLFFSKIVSDVTFNSVNVVSTKSGQRDILSDRFMFGCSAVNFEECPVNTEIQSGPWVLEGWQEYHTDWIQNFSKAENTKRIPYIYTYIMAGMAKKELDLEDCNVDFERNLCNKGANFIRQNKTRIFDKYINMGYQLRRNFGTKNPFLIHMEPDYYQYHSDPNQEKPLSTEESWGIMNELVGKLKKILPNAYFVLDISPWNTDLKTWSKGFSGFSYGGIVGRQFPADGLNKTSKIDDKTYKQMSDLTGLKIIVNTSYGVGGKSNNFDFSWSPRETLEALYSSGVLGVMQPGGGENSYYTELISNYKNNPVKF